MKKFLVFTFILVVMHAAGCQDTQDSLWSIWRDTNRPDTVRLKALGHFAWEGYLNSLPDSAEYYGQIMYDHAAEKGLAKWMGWALRGQGVSFMIRGGNAKALDYWLRSMELSRSVSDLAGVAGSLNNIGIMYYELGDMAHALDYHERSMSLREQSRDSIGYGASLANIGDIYRKQGRMDSAMTYARRSLVHFERIRYEFGVMSSLLRIAEIHREKKEHAKALEYYDRALEVSNRLGKMSTMLDGSVGLGLTHLDMGHPKLAVSHCKQSLDQAKRSSQLVKQRVACDCLYKAYKAMGNRDLALRYLEHNKLLGDSLRNEEIIKDLQQMEFTKELYADSTLTAEREERMAAINEAALDRERNRRNLSIIAGLGVLILAGGLWSRLVYIRRSQEELRKEKAVSDELLHNILPERVAAELKQNGFSAARDFEQATILFSDFKDFTELSARLSATELVAEVDACFEAFDHITSKYGVEKIKTIGDAYMAAGGLPVPSPTAVRNTVLAALDMCEFILQRKAERMALGLPFFEMRIGIHTGPVVAGIVGVKKFQYDLWGDAVNTAARIETSGKVGQVNVSGRTYALLKDQPDLSFTHRGKVQAKGKGELEMYFVVRKAEGS